MKQFLKDNLDRVLAVSAMVVLAASLIAGNKPAKATPAISINVFVDPLTGCQYLTTSSGALVPRLTKIGEHICTAPGEIKEN